jgi:RNA polymerase sigma factor (sigma-70 family)
MAYRNEDAGKVNPEEVAPDLQNELLHDGYGDKYLVNDEHYKTELSRRTNSLSKQQDLELANELLNSDLRQLTEKQRDVMYYRMRRMTYEQIAVKMNITQSAVVQHLNAARKKLAKLIKTTKEVMNNGDWNSDGTNIRD